MRKNIFLALDFNSLNKALEITEKTKDHLAGIFQKALGKKPAKKKKEEK